MPIESIFAIYGFGHAILFNAAMFSRWLALRPAEPTKWERLAGKVSTYLALYCVVSVIGVVWVMEKL